MTRRRLLFPIFSFCFLFLSFSLPAKGAWVDPLLEEKLIAAGPGETVSGLVLLKDRVDLDELERKLTIEKAGYAKRHDRVISAHQDHAAGAQEGILRLMEDENRKGRKVFYRSFWIANAVAVSAEPELFGLLETHPEVDAIYFDYELELIHPVEQADDSSNDAKGIEPGIEIVGAPVLWGMGIDGAGVIVGDMDTGADGSHPAFADRWRGLTADPAECWFDPAESAVFPHDYGSHGTHTLGTMVGDDGQGNQIGMAPKAKWIAAAVIDVPGTSLLTDVIAAFQWFADPDGDPGTIEDVPAVINNSWGVANIFFGSGCKEDFWAAIDVAEAAGVAVVFAAGNEGPRPASLRSPSDRITTEFNTFSVGALNQDGISIAGFSSRGPSKCDGSTVKPEVSAVGKNVRSSTPNGNYGTMSGTSMAAPHVSGAIALLRQAYPEASVEDLKAALYFTATDLGNGGEDNTFGMGRIDLVNAYNFLSAPCDKDQDGHDSLECGGDDCNDLLASVYPGAEEVCDGRDNDCDEQTPEDESDEDEDGQMACEGDCEPADGDIYLGAPELCDGKDNDCNDEIPADELDVDEDGAAACANDCEPENQQVHPGATEQCNGLDDNCDGLLDYTEIDRDMDGYWICQGDCDNLNEAVHPGAQEICWDQIDNDCDGMTDDEDPDCSPQTDDDDEPADDDEAGNDDDGETQDDDAPGAEGDDPGSSPGQSPDDDDDGGCGCL